MIKGIQLENSEYGLTAVLTSCWSNEISSYLADKDVAELVLNDGKGWRGSDISFLSELPELRSLKIIDLKISSIEPIHLLHKLEELKVITYCKTEIRFSEFPYLKVCSLEWRPKATSLFDCESLKELFINRYSGKDTSSFAKLINLESLSILNAPIENLFGLRSLRKLRYLRLANLKRIQSLGGIEDLTNLEELEVHTCRSIASITEIQNLIKLRKLYLNNDGDIESLRPLDKLEHLEAVIFYESTNIVDGDLTPLLSLKNLAQVSFKNRKHYSHRREDFGVAYTG